jgi:hypothetical protein
VLFGVWLVVVADGVFVLNEELRLLGALLLPLPVV